MTCQATTAGRQDAKSILFDMEADVRNLTQIAEMLNDYTSDAEPISESRHSAICYLVGQLLGAANRNEEKWEAAFDAARQDKAA